MMNEYNSNFIPILKIAAKVGSIELSNQSGMHDYFLVVYVSWWGQAYVRLNLLFLCDSESQVLWRCYGVIIEQEITFYRKQISKVTKKITSNV